MSGAGPPAASHSAGGQAPRRWTRSGQLLETPREAFEDPVERPRSFHGSSYRLKPHSRAVRELTVFACRKCGRIWAPANDPGTCPCGQPTKRFDVRIAMRLNLARQGELRRRALLRAERRRRAYLSGDHDVVRPGSAGAGD